MWEKLCQFKEIVDIHRQSHVPQKRQHVMVLLIIWLWDSVLEIWVTHPLLDVLKMQRLIRWKEYELLTKMLRLVCLLEVVDLQVQLVE
jgi:hypothetical protein